MQIFIYTFKKLFPYVLNSLQKKPLISSIYILIDNKDWNVFKHLKILQSISSLIPSEYT